MKRICVFCGSSVGAKIEYGQASEEVGRFLANRKIGLVYGGGRVGIMGKMAKACLEAGGEVIGVIPRRLYDMELGYSGITKMYIVESMHERKAMMAELSDGFIALPGGLGTVEEFFEVLSWAQLGIHSKPCGLLNTGGFYDKLIDFLGYAVEQDFVDSVHRNMILVDANHEELLRKFEMYQAPKADKAGLILNKKDNVV